MSSKIQLTHNLYKPQNTVTATCAFRKVAGSDPGLIYKELAIFSHFLEHQLEISLLVLRWGQVASQLESLVL